ncbi:MAG: hypothetical protein HRU22_13060 [Gammaproteobacteria bacterium]|nr:hypothetical protein [Gammaproteobacteria bacterium]
MVLLLGFKKAKKTPSIEHPLGHGKEIYFWSFRVCWRDVSIYEGVHKLNSTEPLSSSYVAIAVLVFAILAEGGSLWGCIIEINKGRGDRSLWR